MTAPARKAMGAHENAAYRPKHPPGWPRCETCGHALCLHGEDGCLVKRCRCWRTDDTNHDVASQ